MVIRIRGCSKLELPLSVVLTLAVPTLAFAQASRFLTGATSLQSNVLAWLRPIAINLENQIMDTTFIQSTYGDVFDVGLSLDEVRRKAPAVFAPSAHSRMSSKYTFIPTERVLTGLMQAGFVPVAARQADTRKTMPGYARHVVRLRRRFETIQLKDSVPEVVFLNSHDGTSAYQLRMGLFRAVCNNGLIVSRGALPGYVVSHRGNVVDEVINGALQVSQRFDLLAAQVERTEARKLAADEQLDFAERAIALRYPDPTMRGMSASQLLSCRRNEDLGDDLYSTFNNVQENLLRGGLLRHSPSGRLTRTRRITAIREEVRLNSALWDIAAERLAA